MTWTQPSEGRHKPVHYISSFCFRDASADTCIFSWHKTFLSCSFNCWRCLSQSYCKSFSGRHFNSLKTIYIWAVLSVTISSWVFKCKLKCPLASSQRGRQEYNEGLGYLNQEHLSVVRSAVPLPNFVEIGKFNFVSDNENIEYLVYDRELHTHFKHGVQNQDKDQKNWPIFLKVERESLK